MSNAAFLFLSSICSASRTHSAARCWSSRFSLGLHGTRHFRSTARWGNAPEQAASVCSDRLRACLVDDDTWKRTTEARYAGCFVVDGVASTSRSRACVRSKSLASFIQLFESSMSCCLSSGVLAVCARSAQRSAFLRHCCGSPGIWTLTQAEAQPRSLRTDAPSSLSMIETLDGGCNRSSLIRIYKGNK